MSKFAKFGVARTIKKNIDKNSLRLPKCLPFVLIQNFLGFQIGTTVITSPRFTMYDFFPKKIEFFQKKCPIFMKVPKIKLLWYAHMVFLNW